MSDELELDRREVDWPPPREDPPVEPAEPWARRDELELELERERADVDEPPREWSGWRR